VQARPAPTSCFAPGPAGPRAHGAERPDGWGRGTGSHHRRGDGSGQHEPRAAERHDGWDHGTGWADGRSGTARHDGRLTAGPARGASMVAEGKEAVRCG
jgi:hypothetical protein